MKIKHRRLIRAVETGDIKIVKTLLSEGISPNLSNRKKRSLLTIASKKGRIEIVDLLLRVIENINVPDKSGYTAFDYAIQKGHTDVVRSLISTGKINTKISSRPIYQSVISNHVEIFKLLFDMYSHIDFNSTHYEGKSMLYWACSNKSFEIIKLLLTIPNIEIINTNNSPLHRACSDCNLEIVKLLISSISTTKGAVPVDLNLYDNTGYTPLQLAISKSFTTNTFEIIKILLSSGADPNITYKHVYYASTSPLYLVINNGNIELIKLLLEFKCKIDDRSLFEALNIGIGCEDFEIFELLISTGINVDVVDKKDKSLLYRACVQRRDDNISVFYRRGPPNETSTNIIKLLLNAPGGPADPNRVNDSLLFKLISFNDIKLVKLLIDEVKNFNVNIRNVDLTRSTPLIECARLNRPEITELLLRAGSDPSIPDTEGRTPLMMACLSGTREMVELLLLTDVNINTVDNYGNTALKFAVSKRYTGIVELLLSAGANPEIKDSRDNNCLFWAVSYGRVEVVKILLSLPYNQIDINNINKSGDTPLSEARSIRSFDIINLLVEAGADPYLCDKCNEFVEVPTFVTLVTLTKRCLRKYKFDTSKLPIILLQ